MEIYKMIKKYEKKEDLKNIVYTPELVEEKFSGTGIGKKTLKQICEENEIELNFAIDKLKIKGIKGDGEETLKEISERYDKRPLDILTIILVDD